MKRPSSFEFKSHSLDESMCIVHAAVGQEYTHALGAAPVLGGGGKFLVRPTKRRVPRSFFRRAQLLQLILFKTLVHRYIKIIWKQHKIHELLYFSIMPCVNYYHNINNDVPYQTKLGLSKENELLTTNNSSQHLTSLNSLPPASTNTMALS